MTEEIDLTMENVDSDTNQETKKDEQKSHMKWSSHLDFVVTLLGYSLGMADVWRLPYLVYRHGGGAFLIPYMFWMGIFGVPLYFLEICMAQFSGKGPWNVWDICPLFRGFGLTFLIMNLITGTHTSILRAWIMKYLVSSFQTVLPWSTCDNAWNTDGCTTDTVDGQTLNMSTYNTTYSSNTTTWNNNGSLLAEMSTGKMSATEEFWQREVLNRSSGLEEFGTINPMYILFLFVTHVIVYLALVRSVKSLGKLMYVTALGPVILIVIVWIRALTLPGAVSGMAYFITPDFSKLGNIKVWIEAAFMTFYTLGPGWGGLLFMGCHNKFTDNCLRDAVVVTASTLCFGVLNGLVVFSVVGAMSAESNVALDKVITSGGFDLGFIAYPKAITYFPLPQLWAVIFYITLLLPGIDVMTVFLEPVLCVLEEAYPKLFHNRRVPLLTFVSSVAFLAAIPLTAQVGVYIFLLMDWYVATLSVLCVTIVESLIFGWIYGGDRVSRDFAMMLGQPLPAVIRISCAFVIPVSLLVLLVSSLVTYVPPNYGEYKYPAYATGIGWLIATSSLVPVFVMATRSVLTTKGSVKQRFAKLLKANSNWGPQLEDKKQLYLKSERSVHRTWKKLFMFNLTGRGGFNLDICQESFSLTQHS